MTKLEDEIKQKQFESTHQRTILNIYYTSNYLMNAIDEVLSKYNITLHQYNVLRILRGQSGKAISLRELKSRMLDKNADASRIVERLKTKKLLVRKVDKTNRRRVEISIQQSGLTLLQKIDPVIKIDQQLLSKLSDKEIEVLNTLLDKIRG